MYSVGAMVPGFQRGYFVKKYEALAAEVLGEFDVLCECEVGLTGGSVHAGVSVWEVVWVVSATLVRAILGMFIVPSFAPVLTGPGNPRSRPRPKRKLLLRQTPAPPGQHHRRNRFLSPPPLQA